MTNNLPYLIRNKTPTLVTLSTTVIALVLLTSPMLFFNVLLQPVQAQTATMTFKTPEPANGRDPNTGQEYALTFDAQGTLSTNSSGDQPMNGTFQIKSLSDGSMINSGDIESGRLYNNSQGVVSIELVSRITGIDTSCSTSANNIIFVDESPYRGAVDCDLGGDTSAQSSPSSSPITGTTTTTQDKDSDGDGIPDSSDRCTHNSNTRCFKEGDTSKSTATTTSATHEQQPSSSSSSGTGNQTR